MSVPQRVREEADQAERLLQQMAEQNQPTAPAPTNEEPGSAEPPPPVPAEPAPTETPPTPAPAAQPTSPETELQRLQQALQSEAGRRAAQESELAEMRGRLAQLTEQLSKQGKTPAPPPAPPKPLITEEDKKDFGEDMIDFVERMIRQHLGDTMVRYGSRLTQIEQTLQRANQRVESAEKSAQELAFERYTSSLDRLAEGWRATNDDPEFVAWLKNRDTFSRKTRHELLVDAHNAADAETVAEFFRAFWKEKGVAPAQTPAAAPPAPPAQQPTVDPSKLVAPTPSNSPTPASNPRGGKIWTQAEIEQVYDDRMKKRISPEKFAELEKQIEEAVLAGRVQ